MTKKAQQTAQNPLILRCNRLMEAFTKSDDERDFYLDKTEGFIIFLDLDKAESELHAFEAELTENGDRYCQIPKFTFYETKKIMESFVNEKVYDIDTKEKLLEIIQAKEARKNFLEFIYDHHSELEKWQLFYQERSRIRIIEWLRNNSFHFVFEEDLDLSKNVIEKLKENLFESNAPKEVMNARRIIESKAKTYYSNEALNPRPKRGRPPKQTTKLETEPLVSADIYTTVPKSIRPLLFAPDITSAFEVTFSSEFESREDLLASRKSDRSQDMGISIERLNEKLESLRVMSTRMMENELPKRPKPATKAPKKATPPKPAAKAPLQKAQTKEKASTVKEAPVKKKAAAPKKKAPAKKTDSPTKKPLAKLRPLTIAKKKAPPKKKAPAKKAKPKATTTEKPTARKGKVLLRRTKPKTSKKDSK